MLVVTEWAYRHLGLVVMRVDFKAGYPQILMYVTLKCVCYAKFCQIICLLEYSKAHQCERESVNGDHSEYISKVKFRVEIVIDFSALLFDNTTDYHMERI